LNVNSDSGNVNTDSGKSLKSVHLQPESLFTLNQNGCSRSSGMGVHNGPEYAPRSSLTIGNSGFEPTRNSKDAGADSFAVLEGKEFQTQFFDYRVALDLVAKEEEG